MVVMTVSTSFRLLWLAAFVAATARGANAQTAAELAAERYDIDGQHSQIGFATTILGAVKVRGRFGDYESTVIYDPAHPSLSSVSTVIQATSLNTDMEFRDNHLRSPDFFDVKTYPTIEFHSESVVPRGRKLLISGPLTMHGVTRPVSFLADVQIPPLKRGSDVNTAFSAQLRLSRADFRIAGTNKFNPDYNPLTTMLGDSVEITLELYGIHPSYADRSFSKGPPPGVADTIYKTLQSSGVAAALDLYKALKASQPSAYSFSPGQLNLIGRKLAERGAFPGAIGVLRFNTIMFSDTRGVLESLGEVQAMSNDRAGALATYRLALSRFPGSTSAREMVRRLEK
jgi:Uncharacterized conserved protein